MIVLRIWLVLVYISGAKLQKRLYFVCNDSLDRFEA